MLPTMGRPFFLSVPARKPAWTTLVKQVRRCPHFLLLLQEGAVVMAAAVMAVTTRTAGSLYRSRTVSLCVSPVSEPDRRVGMLATR